MTAERIGEGVSSTGSISEEADQMATDIIRAVDAQRLIEEDFQYLKTPKEAEDELPLNADRAQIDRALVERLWAHEDRADIVISKADHVLPYWKVRTELDKVEKSRRRLR